MLAPFRFFRCQLPAKLGPRLSDVAALAEHLEVVDVPASAAFRDRLEMIDLEGPSPAVALGAAPPIAIQDPTPELRPSAAAAAVPRHHPARAVRMGRRGRASWRMSWPAASTPATATSSRSRKA